MTQIRQIFPLPTRLFLLLIPLVLLLDQAAAQFVADCSMGDFVQAKVDAAIMAGGGTIDVISACNESVTIRAGDISIEVNGLAGAQIVGPAGNLNAVLIANSRDVIVRNLTVTSDGNGISIDNSTVDLFGMRIGPAGLNALEAFRASIVNIHGSTLQNSSQGLDARDNSRVSFRGGDGFGNNATAQIINNSQPGIRVVTGASVDVRTFGDPSTTPGSTVIIESNGMEGIIVDDASSLLVEDASPDNNTHLTIANNGEAGVSARGLSRIELRDAKIDSNNGEGLLLDGLAFAEIFGRRVIANGDPFDSMTINSNNGSGVRARDNSVVTVSRAAFNANARSGIFVENNSVVTINRSSVSMNDQQGILANTSSLVNVRRSNVNDNDFDGILGRINTTVTLSNTHVDNNFQSGINLETKSLLVLQGTQVFANGNSVKDAACDNTSALIGDASNLGSVNCGGPK